MNEIDQFVDFLIRENCEGCEECEPRLSSEWKHNFACVEEGRAKWFIELAEKWKEERRRRMTVADVKNTPRTPISGFMVARLVDGELWYYGTYEEKDRAENVAQEIGNGIVLENMQG